ncbi:MAG: hypothetical protein H6719_05995 [Sandaracinaceae bacterium]|nr:hypothetical protein [Sandaracinaceae bacterium]
MPEPLDPKVVRKGCARSIHGHGARSPLAHARQIVAALGEHEDIDVYGEGALIEDFERHVAGLLGKPAGLFLPSGTMAQQIALRIACDERGVARVGYHPSSHLHLHEQQAIAELHRLEVSLLGDPEQPLTAADVEAVDAELGAVLVELPQRELGGVLPSWDALQELVGAIRRKGAAAHMDGARLWESAPFYGRDVAAIAAPFDSVYVSFYKGIGGVAGAVLAGSDELVAAAKIWQRRHGGNLVSLWPYVVSARASLAERRDKMPVYVERMRAYADALRALPGVTLTPDPPHTNMAHVRLPGTAEALTAAAHAVSQRTGVWITHRFTDDGRFELAVGDASLEVEPAEVAQLIADVLREANA